MRLFTALAASLAWLPLPALAAEPAGAALVLGGGPQEGLAVELVSAPPPHEGEVVGWDAARDTVEVALRGAGPLRPGIGLAIVRGGSPIGYLKLEKGTTTARVLFLDGELRPGDRVEERPRRHQWRGLKAGVAWLDGPALVGSYGTEIDLGPMLGLADWSGTLDLSWLNRGDFSGRMGEVGLSRKFFHRRWGLVLGVKAGAAELSGVVDSAVTGGLSGCVGLNCYMLPELVWVTDLALQAYYPVRQAGGAGDGRLVQPWGPMVRTGLAYVF